MADALTSTTTLTELVYNEYIEPLIMDYAIDAMVIAPLTRSASLGGKGTLTVSYPIWVKDSISGTLSEGSDLTRDDLETTEAGTVTAATIGIYREISELARDVNVAGRAAIESFIARDGGQLIAEYIDNALATLFVSFSATAGVSGLDFSVADFLAGLATLRSANARGDIVAVLDDQQANDLSVSVATTTGQVFGNSAANAQSILNGQSNGYLGKLFNVDIWYSNLCDTANSGSDVAGALFVNGASSPGYAALGTAMVHTPRIKIQPDAATISDHITVYAVAGTGIIRNAMGVQVVTDA